MSRPMDAMVLNEVDAEIVALGSLIMAPDAFGEQHANIKAEWFSEPLLRYVFEHCEKLHNDGHSLSRSAVIAALPEDCGAGLSRGAFFARLASASMPVSMLSGAVATMKDRWARRSLLNAAESIKASVPMFGTDPFEIASEIVLSLDTINAAKAERAESSISASATALLASLDNPEALRGPTTGLMALDKKLNGYKAGQLYVFAGRPGMGKSAFMVSSLRRTAEAGFGVAIFSLEMTGQEIAARAMSDMMDRQNAPGFGDLLKGLISEADRDAAANVATTLEGLPLFVDASPRLTFAEIAARARQAKARFEAEGRFLSVLCIDHMGLVTPSDRYRGNKVAEAGEVSMQARALAKELDCCVLLLCQLSREVEKRDDKKPQMSDLRWSGEIEQDAHVVAFLYREHYYLLNDPQAMPHQLAEARYKLDFLIRKNRNGETGDVNLWCSIAHSAVRDE